MSLLALIVLILYVALPIGALLASKRQTKIILALCALVISVASIYSYVSMTVVYAFSQDHRAGLRNTNRNVIVYIQDNLDNKEKVQSIIETYLNETKPEVSNIEYWNIEQKLKDMDAPNKTLKTSE